MSTIDSAKLMFMIPSVGIAGSCVYMLSTGYLPVSVASISSNYVTVFVIMMLIGSVVVVAATLMRGTVFTLNMELAGLMSLSLSSIIYGLTVLTYGEIRPTVGATLSVCFGLACVVRMVEIRRKIRNFEEQQRLCAKHKLDADEIIVRSQDEGRPS